MIKRNDKINKKLNLIRHQSPYSLLVWLCKLSPDEGDSTLDYLNLSWNSAIQNTRTPEYFRFEINKLAEMDLIEIDNYPVLIIRSNVIRLVRARELARELEQTSFGS